MIAPVAFEDLTFPDQKLINWSGYEISQWMRAGLSYFNSLTSVQYGPATLLHTGFQTGGDSIAGGSLALNGKLYLGTVTNSSNSFGYTLDSYNDTTSSLGQICYNARSVAYSAFTNNAYFSNQGYISVVDCSNDTTQSFSPTFAGSCYITNPGPDSTYAYMHNFTVSKKIDKVNLIDTGSVLAFSGSYTGDALKSIVGIDGNMYMGCGGGSIGIKQYNPTTNTVNQLTVTGFANTSDSYRDFAQHYDGYIYSFPAYTTNKPIIRIDTKTSTITNIYTYSGDPRIFSVCVGADGKIYGVGNGDSTVGLRGVNIYDPRTNSLSVDVTSSTRNWRFIIMGALGDLYMFNTLGECWKKELLNKGSVVEALKEFNGIISRFQSP